MVREALRERFLETLEQLGGSAGNARLRGELGWQEDTYQAVRAELVDDALVLPGRGRGGSVALANGKAAPRPRRPQLFDEPPAKPVERPPARPEKRKAENGGSRFEQTFKNIDDVLWKEAGCTTELDYTEQTSWMLFLKYLDDLEKEREPARRGWTASATPSSSTQPYRWSAWAAPKTPDGAFDHNNALTGPDLIDFVNGKLFPYLRGFKTRADKPDTIEYKISEIFGEIATSSAAATACATRWNWSMRCASARRRRSTSCPRCTRTRSSGWATRGATAASTTRRAR